MVDRMLKICPQNVLVKIINTRTIKYPQVNYFSSINKRNEEKLMFHFEDTTCIS